jgi:hypothetical protein
LKQYIIYEIRPINKNLIYSYIGSTISIRNRKSQHKRDSKTSTSTSKLYIFIRENGGWDEFEMVELEIYKCKTKTEARIREQHFIEINENKRLNSYRAYSSIENKKIDKKNNYQNNRCVIIERSKNYYKKNKYVIANKYKNRILFLCTCGVDKYRWDLKRHYNTKFHIKNTKN